jgi:hypothetical protein
VEVLEGLVDEPVSANDLDKNDGIIVGDGQEEEIASELERRLSGLNLGRFELSPKRNAQVCVPLMESPRSNLPSFSFTGFPVVRPAQGPSP